MFNKIDSKTVFISLYIFAVFVFITHFILVGKGVYGDGRYYYSYLPSLIIDHNLKFESAFKYFGIEYFRTPLGNPANIYPIGPAITWTIPFILIHLILSIFKLNDGYNSFYQIAIGIWNITLVFIGLYFLYKTLLKFVTKNTSIYVTSMIFLATNLLFYGSVDVINSHSASFFASSLFLYFWLNKKIKLTGIMLGLLVLIRPQDALFAMLPISSLIIEKRSYAKNFLILAIISLITFFPQLLIWKILWGTWYVNPYLKVETFNFMSPHILGVLFNKDSGLFLWTPIIIICVFGLFKFIKKNKTIGIPFILLFLGQLYVVSSWSVWWQGASFSGRMFISSLPILSVGLAYILNQKQINKIKYLILSFFALLNIILITFFLSLK